MVSCRLAALDEFKNLAPGKASITGGSEIANRPVTQHEFAQAEAEFKAARTWLYETMDNVWSEVVAGRTPTAEQISDMRLSCTYKPPCCQLCCPKNANARRDDATYTNNVFSRFVNDTNVVTQHAFMGDATFTKCRFNQLWLKPAPGYL